MNADTNTNSALLLSTRPTVAVIGALAFNTDLAVKLRGLKKSIKATTVRQEYRSTGSQSHRRQIWVRAEGLSRGFTDLWLDAKSVSLGGVSPLAGLPPIPYGERTVDEVYDLIVQALRTIIAG
jgi:hypothetical protein